MADVKKEVESLLFASGRAMLAKDLADIIQVRAKDVEKAIKELKEDYDRRDTSMTLMETPEGWKMNVKEKYVSLVTKIVADTELPFPLLETLSVIAYKAPAWQAEVIKVRGTNAYEHIQQLIDAGFIDRRKKGRSFELVLTQKFFEYFDVQGDKSLKMMFQDVKPSEPAPKRKKIGDLPVVDIPAEQKQLNDKGEPVPAAGTLGGLEVVDVPKPKPKEQFKPDDEFLSHIESRIGDVSKRNDDYENDEDFKRPAVEGAQPAEGENTFEPPENEKMKEIFGEEKPAASGDENPDEEFTPKESEEGESPKGEEEEEAGEGEKEEEPEEGSNKEDNKPF